MRREPPDPRGFLEAVAARGWGRAWDRLPPDTRARETAEAFGRRAETCRRGVGFEPVGVRMRACEEHGDGAIAHVTLVGWKPAEQLREALVVRRVGGAWYVLPPVALTKAAPR